MLVRISLQLCVLTACVACGSTTAIGAPSPDDPLSASQRVIFEDGVDLLQDPDALQDRWRADWESELNARVADSDLIAIGKVTNFRTHTDPSGTSSYRLTFVVQDALAGELHRRELSLVSKDGAPGYGSIGQHREHMLEQPLIAFIKYALEANDEVVAHFHLAFPSQPVKSRVAEHEEAKTPYETRIKQTSH